MKDRRWCLLGRVLIGALVMAASACTRDPHLTYAHLLERAASWSASVQFTNDLLRQQRVPHTYARDVWSAAAREIDSLRQQIVEADEISDASRNEAAGWCGRLASLTEAADRSNLAPDDRELRDLEVRLRAAATRERARSASAETSK
jgi:hypothetical protein